MTRGLPATPTEFVQRLLSVGDAEAIAILEAPTGRLLTYAQLRDAVERRAGELAGPADLALVIGRRSIAGALDYLGAMLAGHTVIACDGAAEAAVQNLTASYSPAWILGGRDSATGYEPAAEGALRRRDAATEPPARGLSLMLSTSGSTGNPKCVMLGAPGLYDNTSGIAEVLRITPADRAVTTLPFFYGYGLSVLHSHLSAGASVLLTDRSVVERAFWQDAETYRPTSLPGVPSIYHLLERLKFDPGAHVSLRKFTQSGALLDAERATAFARKAETNGTQLYLMYGQTESSARISTLPPEEVLEAPVSGGYPLPRTRVELTDPRSGEQGQLRYFSTSVMWGYATGRSDTGSGDAMGGVLDTGDLARLDERGRIWICGRLKRIAKVHGLRISLDDVETLLPEVGPVAALPADDRVLIAHACADQELVVNALQRVATRLGLRPRDLVGHLVPELPTTAVGKTDYLSLAAEVNGRTRS